MVNGQGLIRQIIYCIILTSISHFSSGTLKADEDCKLVVETSQHSMEVCQNLLIAITFQVPKYIIH